MGQHNERAIMMVTGMDMVFVAVGAAGIFAAHAIESKREKQDIPIAHMARIAAYWSLGALAYFALIRR